MTEEKYKKLLLLIGTVILWLSFSNTYAFAGEKRVKMIDGVPFYGAKGVRIDEVPMYGGMDRKADERFRKGDEKFIKKISRKFGGREAASRVWVDQGFTFYFRDNFGKAMRRFNQAWLLDPNNPEVYHGFASVLKDQGDACGSMEMIEKGLELEWTAPKYESGFLADAAKMISYCAVDRKNDGNDEGYSKLIEKSDSLFLRAEALEKAKPELRNGYLYANWWMALYYRGEYAEAWEKVFLMRKEGGELSGNYVEGLKQAMPEPTK